MLCAGRAPAEPALWSVRDADSTIYLFGTAHAVRKDSPLEEPKIDAAMARSTELWLEIADDLGQNQEATAGIMRRLGFDPARPLVAIAAAGAPCPARQGGRTLWGERAQLEPMRPWLAAMTIGTLPLAKAGLDTTQALTRRCARWRSRRRMRCAGSRRIEQQLRFLADMSEAEQVAFLAERRSTRSTRATDQIACHLAAWRDGDVKTLGRIVVEDLKKESRSLYRRLTVDRNVAWAARSEARWQARARLRRGRAWRTPGRAPTACRRNCASLACAQCAT
jgi:uncharacterized protein YbaP (TraB family)